METANGTVTIRESRRDDEARLEALYRDAFPNEALWPLVERLLRETPGVLSLVTDAAIGPARGPAGHAIFTPCAIPGRRDAVALMGPLAVAPGRQRRGLGRALIEAGSHRLGERGFARVFVLGDPAYYGRLGFRPERVVLPPHPLPAEWTEAWQSRDLRHTDPALAGKLSVPPAWNEPTLWAP